MLRMFKRDCNNFFIVFLGSIIYIKEHYTKWKSNKGIILVLKKNVQIKYLKLSIIILLVFIVFRLLFLMGLEPWNKETLQKKILIKDSAQYHNLGREIIESHTFTSYGFRTPGYPVFLAFIYFLFGTSFTMVFIFQIVIDIGTLFILYLISLEIFKEKKTAYLATFLYAINILNSCYVSRLLSEILFTFFMTLAVLIFLKAIKDKHKLYLYSLTGIITGIATLIRPIAQYVPLLMTGIIIFQTIRFKNKIASIICLISCFLIIISIWQFRNLNKYNHYSLTTIKGYTMLRNIYIFAKGTEKESYENIKNEYIQPFVFKTQQPFVQEKNIKKRVYRYIKTNPIKYLQEYIKGSLNIFIATAKTDILTTFNGPQQKDRGAVLITESFVEKISRISKNITSGNLISIILFSKQFTEYILFFIGLTYMFITKKKGVALILILIILYFSLPVGMSGAARFRVPIMPYIHIVSAYGLIKLYNKYFKKIK